MVQNLRLSISNQCLGITCDSASNNDTMIDELVDLLPNYPGAANRCRCFLHVVNLVAKSLLKQFEVPKKDVDAALDAAEQELLELAAGADMEELVTVAERGLGNNEDADDMNGWVNEMNLLSDDESEELRQSIQPVRLVLVKVRVQFEIYCTCCSDGSTCATAPKARVQDTALHNKVIARLA
jgi:hypothetical protein